MTAAKLQAITWTAGEVIPEVLPDGPAELTIPGVSEDQALLKFLVLGGRLWLPTFMISQEAMADLEQRGLTVAGLHGVDYIAASDMISVLPPDLAAYIFGAAGKLRLKL